jgi:two-component system, sensor histidine kinase
LGLAISKRLVEMMGGEIGVASMQGQGAAFWFTVPLPLAEKTEPLPSTAAPLEDTDTVNPFQAPLILLVEDNAANGLLFERQLSRMGYRVHVVTTGREAVAALAPGHAYTAVLMDVQMPEMNGIDATRTIRSREIDGAHVPIIALTANSLIGDRERCLQAGMDDYISKPASLVVLRDILQKWVKNGSGG